MKLSQQSLSTIESAIQKAAGKYVCLSLIHISEPTRP